ncbi:MAG: DMT family transporter [Pseudomonadota bacterium]|nr:DMT family transporter [Pseudomonadota bacterium]
MTYSLRNLANITFKIREPTKSRRNLFSAILILLTGIFFLDIMGVFIKHLGQTYSPTFLAVARNLFGFLPILVMLLLSKNDNHSKIKLSHTSFSLIFVRGLSITGAQFCFYLALVNLEFATASTLAFAGPFFLTALSIPILGAKVGIWRWGAVVLGFIGIILIMGVGSDLFSVYALLPLGAACGYALSSVVVKLFPSELPTVKIQFNSQIFTIISAIALMYLFDGYTTINSVFDLILIALMGISGGLGVICLISAYRMTEPSIIAPFEYFGIPLAIFLGWIFFSEFPFSQLFPGVLLIFAAGIIIIWREEKIKNA